MVDINKCIYYVVCQLLINYIEKSEMGRGRLGQMCFCSEHAGQSSLMEKMHLGKRLRLDKCRGRRRGSAGSCGN